MNFYKQITKKEEIFNVRFKKSGIMQAIKKAKGVIERVENSLKE